MRIHAKILAAVLTLTVASAAKANLLLNGGLEATVQPTQPDNLVYTSTHTNTSALGPGWSITYGSVDVVPNSYFQSSEGNFSVDLVGTPGVGVLAQTIATTIGDHYQLTFDYSVNPENLTGEIASTKALSITATGASLLHSQTYIYPFATPTKTNMHYVVGATFLFIADSSSTTLSLTALLSNLPSAYTSATAYCGPIIDNLDLNDLGGNGGGGGGDGGGGGVPEPASLATLAIGGLLLLKRRSARRSI